VKGNVQKLAYPKKKRVSFKKTGDARIKEKKKIRRDSGE